jgi:UDPglucose 6-dehydrogenase
MDITIIGTGYVGLVTGTCFSEMGNRVTCVDVDASKIKALKAGEIPIYEPGLKPLVIKNSEAGNLCFTTDLKEALEKSKVVFIAVGTPMGEDGSADLKHIAEVARSLGRAMDREMIVVNKSTVPVGTADKVRTIITEELRQRGLDLSFDVVSNPEFLKEGAAIQDFMKPDRVVIGSDSKQAIATLKKLYAPFCMSHDRFIVMDIRSAEMTKYAANAMLATKISFMNEIAALCERLGADVNQVRVGIGSDTRIGYHFIYPGCGYGGSCFPKDVRALVRTGEEIGFGPELLNAVESVNNAQKKLLAQKVVKRFGEDLSGMIFAIWGLAFKHGTDDMREAPSLYIIDELLNRGARIQAYDPKAAGVAGAYYFNDREGIEYASNRYEALREADALLLVTEWKEFRAPDFERIKQNLVNPVIFDGRNQYHSLDLPGMGFEYHQIGKEMTTFDKH